MEIEDLQPNTIYELKLKLHDKADHSSPFSEKIECRTLEDGNYSHSAQLILDQICPINVLNIIFIIPLAPGVVVDVQWEAVNTTGVRVEWKKPRSGPVSQFNVSLLALDESKTIQLLIDGSRTSTEVFFIPVFVCVNFSSNPYYMNNFLAFL